MPGALHFSLLCFSLHFLGSSAFNLDITETILKYGDNGSFFGFSVALHQQLRPQPVSWLLVGAPQAAALQGQKANRTGGLYACPLTHETNDCKRLTIDEGVDLKKESKENQWLGVTVKSQGPGGKIVTCAHLYEARNRVNEPLETRDVIGRCYVLSEGLEVSDEFDGGEWKFCEGRPQGHDRFGFCQQGMATGFTADRHYILFGAPGTYNWKGTIRAELSGLDLSHYDDGPYEAGGEKDQDPSLIPLPANSYLGFSLDSGVGIIRRNELSFVTGAPRANHTGAVVILKRDNVNRLVPEVILEGEKLTSSFGYSVAVVDLNNDGWMDLVVGAPNLFDRKEGIGGAVYVYINQAERLKNVIPVRLNGSYDSMFGITVGAVGDLNQDGFQDFAVGAPLDGDGKVYIYHGSNLGFVTKPAQILTGESVGIKMFGYSFSGGLDIDGNMYPDLLVGSLSDTVVLYRSRPVIHISRNITVTPQNVDLENMNCRYFEGICVDVKACFSYTANPPSYSPPITLEYTFDADADHQELRRTPRVTFRNRKTSDPEHQYSGTVQLPQQHVRSCTKATMQLKDHVRDKLRPIVVLVSYNIKHTRSRRQTPGATLGALSPVLNALPPNSQRTEVNFLKQGCGEDKICQSNLQLSHRFSSRIDDSLFHPLPRGDDGLDIFSMTDQKVVALEIFITNFPSDPDNPQQDGDDAHEAMLLVFLPPTLPYSAVRPFNASGKTPACVSNQNASYVECELGNPMKRGAQFRFYLVLSTSGITLETEELEVGLELSTTSEQPGLAPVIARARVVMELPLSVTGMVEPQQLFYSGEVRGESAMTKESEVGSPVRYQVMVTNRGQSLNTLGSAFLNLMWPHEIANGKWLLYPLKLELEVSTQPQKRTTCSPEPNPLRLALEYSHQSRKKREAQQTEAPSRPLTYWERRKNATLDCAQGTARCQLFQCPLHSFDRSAVLTIWGRLWNSTFLEEYSDVTSVEVIVRASITVKSTIRNLILKDATAQIPVTVYLDPIVALARGIPWWIILIAVLAGILVLGLLVSILWKLGFFKRVRYEEAKVPQYHAVKIPRQERQLFREEKTGTITKKDWVTNWSGDNDGYVPVSA
ncbi:integrin alpha-7 isoform X1 [Anolis carolinensis]|uniref:Integrin subunit alpha 7 n=1 Tax=Anolis carolinensis TaxID=28377 RepID=A0A803STD8_ANOCA|nr:PREDICTED: integrin alpha-7 isoform X1 [Anolis carolinensis]|eukprot:XP_016850467.1 PREDICTED: integrin alpha-7 isoform X1 [Anolis carolinensis]